MIDHPLCDPAKARRTRPTWGVRRPAGAAPQPPALPAILLLVLLLSALLLPGSRALAVVSTQDSASLNDEAPVAPEKDPNLAVPFTPAEPPAPDAFVARDEVAKDLDALTATEERFGVRVLGLHLASGGYMISLRVRVTDSAKAAPLVAPGQVPHLKDKATQSILIVPSSPKFGALKPISGEPLHEGRVYTWMFADPGQIVKAGGLVQLSIGEFVVDDLVVH